MNLTKGCCLVSLREGKASNCNAPPADLLTLSLHQGTHKCLWQHWQFTFLVLQQLVQECARTGFYNKQNCLLSGSKGSWKKKLVFVWGATPSCTQSNHSCHHLESIEGDPTQGQAPKPLYISLALEGALALWVHSRFVVSNSIPLKNHGILVGGKKRGWATPGYAQSLFLAVFSHPYTVPGIEPLSATCKLNNITSVQSLQSWKLKWQ